MAEEAARLASPRISIIVPVYKVEQYLRRCLDSIAAQTFTDWECILIDDGSPDASGAICDEYAERDARFRVIHQENRGVSAARNAGLDAARGEWIGFVDSDDWIEPNMYEYLYNNTVKTKVDCVTCDCYLETKGGCSTKNVFTSTESMENLRNLISCSRQGWVFLCLFRNDVIEKCNVRFPNDIEILEDEIFQIHFFMNAKASVYVKKSLYHYNLNSYNSATYSLNELKALNIIKANEEIRNLAINSINNIENELKFRFAKSKCWIIRKLQNFDREIFSVWNEESLSKVENITLKQRIVLRLCEYNFFFGIMIIKIIVMAFRAIWSRRSK